MAPLFGKGRQLHLNEDGTRTIREGNRFAGKLPSERDMEGPSAGAQIPEHVRRTAEKAALEKATSESVDRAYERMAQIREAQGLDDDNRPKVQSVYRPVEGFAEVPTGGHHIGEYYAQRVPRPRPTPQPLAVGECDKCHQVIIPGQKHRCPPTPHDLHGGSPAQSLGYPSVEPRQVAPDNNRKPATDTEDIKTFLEP